MSSPQDRRDAGVLNPATLPARFWREDPEDAVAQLVRWWWLAEWDLPEGQTLPQPVLAFPASNLTVEAERIGLAGPTTTATTKTLLGKGWVIGALLQPAAIPALVREPRTIVDHQVELEATTLHQAVLATIEDQPLPAAIPLISTWIQDLVGNLTQEALLANQVNRII